MLLKGTIYVVDRGVSGRVLVLFCERAYLLKPRSVGVGLEFLWI
jgi:hypothetical protein